MNRIITLAVVSLMMAFSNLISKENEIVLGSSYANDVWFSFKSGVAKTESTTNWDIAFLTHSQNAGIWTNSAKGVTLYVVKDSDGDSWDSPIDTTGMAATWTRGYNSIDSWDVGAFNLGLDGFSNDGDFGWGSYDMSTHAIAGSKVFVIKLSASSYKKIMIESLLGGIYTVLIADLDGANEVKKIIKKSDYSSKLYIYMDMATTTMVDREPSYDQWDLVFSKYTDLIDMGTGTPTPYTVTGVRTHPLYRTAIVKGVPTSNSNAPVITDEDYSSKITEIGSGWKKFINATASYKIVDSVSYFTTFEETGATNPLIQKIVFKEFAGSSTGRIVFDLNGGATSVDEKLLSSLNIFPSVVEKSSKVSVDLGDYKDQSIRSIRLFNTAGNLVNVINANQDYSNGNFEISLSDISSGEYFMVFEFANTNLMKKVIIK